MYAQLDYILVLLGTSTILITITVFAIYIVVNTKRELTIHRRSELNLRMSQERLRNLSAHILSVRENEAARIARDIHDELGQSLTAIKFDVSWLARQLPDAQNGATQKIATINDMIDSMMTAGERISSQLRPTVLDDLGLAAALEWEVEQFQNRVGIECELIIRPEKLGATEKHATAIYRITQEALTNVARHARASKVEIELWSNPNNFSLKIVDNGVGMTEGRRLDPESFGLLGIKERVHQFGGTLDIISSEGAGTKVHVILPKEYVRQVI